MITKNIELKGMNYLGNRFAFKMHGSHISWATICAFIPDPVEQEKLKKVLMKRIVSELTIDLFKNLPATKKSFTKSLRVEKKGLSIMNKDEDALLEFVDSGELDIVGWDRMLSVHKKFETAIAFKDDLGQAIAEGVTRALNETPVNFEYIAR